MAPGPEILARSTEITETNYFFKLKRYQPWLVDILAAHEDFIFPRFRQKQVIEFLKDPLNDLCISRPRERLEWGIPLPFDEGYVTYVWFDALVNYYSAVADQPGVWPATWHVIGGVTSSSRRMPSTGPSCCTPPGSRCRTASSSTVGGCKAAQKCRRAPAMPSIRWILSANSAPMPFVIF